MSNETHDLGYLKRVDRGDGWTDLLDGFGKIAATVRTDSIASTCNNLAVRRFRITEHRQITD